MNIELSKNNHMVWGYNDVPWSSRTSPYDRFFVTYGKIKEKLSFRESCISAADQISEKARQLNKKPLVFFSGGIDSEAIVYSFLLSKKDFSIVHLRYNRNLNDHEYHYVKKISERYNLDIIFFDIDIMDFLLKEETLKKSLRDNGRMIELHALTSITEKIKDNFFPVLDHPGTYLCREEPDMSKPGNWFYKEYEHRMFYYNYCLNENLDACPSFFLWNPEIMYSWLTDPLIQDLVNDRIPGKITCRTSTIKLYQNTFPEYFFEERTKYTGYEYVSRKILDQLNFSLYKERKYDRHSGQVYRYTEILDILK